VPDPRVHSAKTGLIAGTSAYFWWGLSPLYFKLFVGLPPVMILAHRVIWSVAFLLPIVMWQRAIPDVLAILRSRRTLLTLCLTGALVATNWGVYILAVTTNHILEASLGYFATPLLNMLLGVTVLKERLRKLQLVAVAMATAALLYLLLADAASARHLWIPAGLALSFSIYGLLRKVTRVSPTTGTLVETAFLTPFALLALMLYTPGVSLAEHPLLLTSGAFTCVPLLLFATAAHSLRLTTIGFLQYIGPTVQFLLAVLIYHEKFTATHAVTFGLIWLALVVYTCDSVRAYRSATAPAATPEPEPV
jgi:chloramphenicol-sensitive protein RarD